MVSIRVYPQNDMQKIREAMVKEWVNADKVCRRAGRFLSPAEHERLCTHTENYLLCYNALAHDSLERKTFLFKVIPKHHASTHVYDIRVNPRVTHCYADEDMVGRMKRIFNGCHMATAPRRSIERYCVVVCLRWWAALHELQGLPYEF